MTKVNIELDSNAHDRYNESGVGHMILIDTQALYQGMVAEINIFLCVFFSQVVYNKHGKFHENN